MVVMVQAQVDCGAGKDSPWLLEHTSEDIEGNLFSRDVSLYHVDVYAQHHCCADEHGSSSPFVPNSHLSPISLPSCTQGVNLYLQVNPIPGHI